MFLNTKYMFWFSLQLLSETFLIPRRILRYMINNTCKLRITSRGVRATVAVEKQWVSHNLCVCVCSLRCTVSNAHALYCHLWPASLYNIFRHYLLNGTIFEKRYPTKKMCFSSFCTTFVWNIFHSKKNGARYDKKMYVGLPVKYPLLLSDFNEN
jgi:hypothetical protein